MRWVLLFVAAVILEAAWLGLAEIEAWGLAPRFGDLQHMVAMAGGTPMLVVAWMAARRWKLSPRWELTLLLLGALVIRGVLWFEPLEGTDDAWRYLWDGHVQEAGINPYQHPPEAEELDDIRDQAIYPNVYRPWLPTCYPPVAEGWFWVGYKLRSGDFFGWKLVLLLHELAAIPLLWAWLRRRGSPGAQAAIYALAPLAAVQHMVGMHMDALYVPWLAAAFWLHRDRPGLAGAAVAMATMVRPLAIAALPALMWGRRWREAGWMAGGALVAGVLTVLPYADAGVIRLLGSIPEYMMTWEFNGAIYSALKGITGSGETARWIGYGATAALCAVWFTRTRWSASSRFLAAVGTYFLLTPTLYPWYLAMALVPWLAVGGLTPLALGGIASLAEAVWIPHAAGLPWRMPISFLLLEYGLLAAFLALDLWWRRRQRGPDAG